MTIATTINTTICHHESTSGPTHTTTKPCGHHPGFPSQVLLDAGADPNIKDNYGKTPLHDAAEYGHEEVVKVCVCVCVCVCVYLFAWTVWW